METALLSWVGNTDLRAPEQMDNDQRGRALAVIEAKKQAIRPYIAKQQALPYAKQLGAPFIFLTNGELIYFWDYQNDDARSVNSFFSPRDLKRLIEMRSTRKALATIEIPEHYMRQGEARTVRPYQQDTMRALDRAVELGKRRFLIEPPTGTGKTDLICLYLKRLIQAGRAERILFLVDRNQLAKQAIGAIQEGYLAPYQQMHGRGTRTAPHIDKRHFVIYDFFKNHEYFNDSGTDVFTGTGGRHAPGGKRTGSKPSENLVELGREGEWIEAVTYVEVGPDGERVDKRKYVTTWEETIRGQSEDDDILKKVKAGELLTPEEEANLARLRGFVRDEVFPCMASLVKDEPRVAEYFRDAVLEIVDPAVLKQVVDELDPIGFKKPGPDVKGDVFEYLLTHLGQSALNGKVLKSDVSVAKNYLSEAHVKELSRIVSAYRDLTENRAECGRLMKMADWASFLNNVLELSDYPILTDKGKVSALKAEGEEKPKALGSGRGEDPDA